MTVLNGLRANNLLGFLAALGVCRLTQCRLFWTRVGPLECAALDTDRTLDDLADELLAKCKNPPCVSRCSEKNLKLEINEWLSLPDDWAAAIACETTKRLARSPLLTYGSNGREVTTVMRKLCKELTLLDIQAALSGPWRYRQCSGLQWDPAEYRVAGERWAKPKEDKAQVAVGPTRLAIEGLPLWPTLTATNHQAIRYATWQQPLSPTAVRGRILSQVGDHIYECDRITNADQKGRVSFDVSRVLR